ncbi:hypothetical protein Tco_1188507 [Tanacetum coccineum]
MVEVHPEGIDAIINGSGSAVMWFGEAEENFLHNVSKDKETVEVGARVAVGYNANLQFGVAERLSQTFRAESTGLRAEAPKIAWVKFRNHSEPSGSSDTSEGSNNIESFEDSEKSDEEDSEDGASSEEGGSKTPQVRRSNKESKAQVRYSPLANYFLLTENGEPASYSEALSSKESIQWKKAIIEEMVSLEKNQTCSLVRISAGKKASQRLWMFKIKEEQNSSEKLAGQEENLECRLKEIMCGLIQAPRLRYLKFDSFMQKDKVNDMLVTGSDMAEFNKPKCLARGVQFDTSHAFWHDHAVWPESEQFSSELNNISLV